MTGFISNIEQLTLSNTHFRKVLFTSQHAQLVVMCLQPNEDIGMEIHEIVDQFLRIEQGRGKAIKAGDAILIPAKVEHNLVNTSSTESLKLYTIYTPPHHKDGTIHSTKLEAQNDTTDHI